MSESRLYTEVDKSLQVYSLTDLSSTIASYPLGLCGVCSSGLIIDSRLYLGVRHSLIVYEVAPSLTEPLILVSTIRTEWPVYKIVRLGQELLLGEVSGYL